MNYRRYLLRRALSTIPVFFGVSVLIFVIARVIPGKPARLALGPRATDEAVAQLRRQMGLDQPLWTQYVEYMTGLLRGDMGQSLVTNNNVATDIAQFLPATVELTTAGMLIAIVFGVPLGVVAGQHKDEWPDNASRSFAFFGVSLPRFWSAIVLQVIFAFGLGWFPATGRIGDVELQRITGLYLVDSVMTLNPDAFVSVAWHLFLPALTLSLAPMADIARITRSSFLEEFNKDYIEGLRVHSIPKKFIAYKYILKRSFTSTLTIIGLDYGFLIGGAFLVEIVFSWPGMSAYGVRAILQKDINAIVGVTLVIGVAFLLANFLVDVLYGYLDPRVRFSEEL